MAKVKISREDIIELIKKQFEVETVVMDKFGNVSLELDLDKVVKEKKATYYTYPVYISPQTIPPRKSPYYWYGTSTNCNGTYSLSLKSGAK